MTCEQLGPDVVALALGALDADQAARIEAHLKTCAPCRAERDAATSLVAASRAAPAASPSPESLDRLLVAFRAERGVAAPPAPAHAEVPPPTAMPRRRSRVLTIALPLAAAACVVVAVLLRAPDDRAQVFAGKGHFVASGSPPDAGLVLGGGSGEFAFAAGDEISSGTGPLSVRIELDPGARAAAASATAPGRVEITLQPGARVVRRGTSDLDLVAGTIEVAAGSLAKPLTILAGRAYAAVKGTRFVVSTTEKRLVVTVTEGTVVLGRDGAASETLTAGEEGLVDSERLLERRTDGRRPGEGFLTPRATLAAETSGAPEKPSLRVKLEAGDGGAVSILPFEDSEPRFLLRLKGDDGREREVKLQRAMLAASPPAVAGRTWRLDASAAYELTVEPAALGVAPGRYEAIVRYMSYRARSDGAEWLGVVESAPVSFEVPVR
jgi:ferric-dicitrate binding protein FerR (iron transport regulator)